MKFLIRRGPRFLNHLYASLFGYFWLPCPLCHQPFGGHEWLHDLPWSSVPTNDGSGNRQGICPRCARQRIQTHGPVEIR